MISGKKTVVWGTALGLGLFATLWVFAAKFPDAHMPIGQGWMTFGLVTALLIAILVSAYRRLLRRAGYWLLLCGLLAVHIGCYSLFLFGRLQNLSPVESDALYGIVGGVEFVGFALAILKVYRVGPDVRWL